jgi:hypothetical chaperone protein
MDRYLGLDFGTTNTALARCGPTGDARLTTFRAGDGRSDTFRSVLYLDPVRRTDAGEFVTRAGPAAIEAYLAGDGTGRLVQSLKSYLASALFQSTNVFGRTMSLEDLITLLLKNLRREAADELGDPESVIRGAVVGRPVRFANSDGEADEALALRRLRTALGRAGFEDVRFEYEPVGAAYFHEAALDHDELVLIGDFGGGTSDFCLMRVGPSVRAEPGSGRILGTEGVGMAGDAFDSEVVDRAVSPRFGKGMTYRSYLDGKEIPVPVWLYAKLRRWHHLSFLRTRETLQLLRELRAQSDEETAAALDALLHLVEMNLGFHLARRVEGAKITLSREDLARITLHDGPVDLDEPVSRGDFDTWIAPQLDALGACVDRLFAATGAHPRDVDAVFLTGGSSLVPAVREVFRARFGDAKLRTGHELTSVALGLALRAREGVASATP